MSGTQGRHRKEIAPSFLKNRLFQLLYLRLLKDILDQQIRIFRFLKVILLCFVRFKKQLDQCNLLSIRNQLDLIFVRPMNFHRTYLHWHYLMILEKVK